MIRNYLCSNCATAALSKVTLLFVSLNRFLIPHALKRLFLITQYHYLSIFHSAMKADAFPLTLHYAMTQEPSS